MENYARYCEIIIFRGGSIFVDLVEPTNNEFTSPTNTFNKAYCDVDSNKVIRHVCGIEVLENKVIRLHFTLYGS